MFLLQRLLINNYEPLSCFISNNSTRSLLFTSCPYLTSSRRFRISVHKGRIIRHKWVPRIKPRKLPYILTKTVPGIGAKGSCVYLFPDIGRRHIVDKAVGILGTWENFQQYFDPHVAKIEKHLELYFKKQEQKKKASPNNAEFEKKATTEGLRCAYRVVLVRERNTPITIWNIFSAISKQHSLDLLLKDVEPTADLLVHSTAKHRWSFHYRMDVYQYDA